MGDEIFFAGHGFRDDTAIVFVAPHNKVDAVVKHAFRYKLLGSVFYSGSASDVALCTVKERTDSDESIEH